MPAKSKRKNRKISQKRKNEFGLEENVASGDVIITDKPNNNDFSSGSTLKSTDIIKTTQSYFISDVKWIVIVTGIIIVALVICYVRLFKAGIALSNSDL